MLSEKQTTRKLSSTEMKSAANLEMMPQEEDSGEQHVCDFCGIDLSASGLSCSDRRKYCSQSCQSKASQRRIKARMAAPPTKRYSATLKFSDPLYFN
ncbi:MAG: hypothetical protein ABSE82_07210 [Nitrososphaerales archaeon]|jgi:hypothetical protein